MSLEILDLEMVLVLKLADLDVLDVLHFCNLLLGPFKFVDQLSVLNIAGGVAVD